MPKIVMSYLGTWNETSEYQPVSLANMILCPVVIYNGVQYIWNGTANPTVGTAPSSDSAWTDQSVAPAYATILGITGTITAGALTINGGTNAKSSNITVNATTIAIPLNKVIRVQAILNITTAEATGVTLAWTAANATVTLTDTVAIGASVTGGIYFVNGIITSTSTASPTISLTASGVTGSPAANAGTSITLTALT